MHLELIFVGKTNFPEIDQGIKRYLDRLHHYIATSVMFVRPEKISKKISEKKVLEAESQRVLKALDAGSYVVVWDQRGKQLDSLAFARFLERIRNEGTSKLSMVIGGPLGISARLIEQANSVFSLSAMTFPHDLARLMVVEQVYRAFTILEGTPYHK